MVYFSCKSLSAILDQNYGEVSERLIELVSKTSVPFRVPRVRIPPSPFFGLQTAPFCRFFFISSNGFSKAERTKSSSFALAKTVTSSHPCNRVEPFGTITS